MITFKKFLAEDQQTLQERIEALIPELSKALVLDEHARVWGSLNKVYLLVPVPRGKYQVDDLGLLETACLSFLRSKLPHVKFSVEDELWYTTQSRTHPLTVRKPRSTISAVKKLGKDYELCFITTL